MTVHYLEQSWDRPVRHNKGLELWALQNVLDLGGHCEDALQQRETVPLLPPTTDVATAYQWEAALLTVGRTIPFDKAELIALNDHRVRDQYPELFDRWHHWLWLDLAGEPVRTREALGASAILAMACNDLNTIAHDVMAAHDAPTV